MSSNVFVSAPLVSATQTDSAENDPTETKESVQTNDRHPMALPLPFRLPDPICHRKNSATMNRSLSVATPLTESAVLGDSTPRSPRRFSAIHAGTLCFPLHPSTPVAQYDVARRSETLLGSSCDETSSDDEINVAPPRRPAGSCSSTMSDRKGSRPPTIGEDDTWNQGAPTSSPALRKDGQPKRLSRSGSSVNCSTTASISARSTCSSLSKPLRSFVIEDCGASSKSGGGSTARFVEGGGGGGRLEGRRMPSTDVVSMTPSSLRRIRCPLAGSMGPLVNSGSMVGDEEDPWVATPLKTARESAACREARRNSLGIGAAGVGTSGAANPRISSPGTGSGVLSSSVSKHLLAAPPAKVSEARNDDVGRLLRVTQKSVVAVQGVLSTQTRIEVFDISTPTRIPIFAVRHCDSSLWGRQMKVHKNILLAARLAGVDVPSDLEIPFDSRKMFEQTDNIQHMHGYLEKTVPHIKLGNRPGRLRLFWWRAIGNGVAVLQNLDSGKLLLLRNPERTIPSALDSVLRILNSPKLLSPAFHEPDLGYATSDMVEKELESRSTDMVELADLDFLITRIWGQEENVSPLTTQLIVRVNASRFLRYSIGTDHNDPKTLLMQVHLNEPFSRGTNAYPVCMSAVPIESLQLSSVRLAFKRAVWFLRKLHEVHLEMQLGGATTGGGGSSIAANVCPPWAAGQAGPAVNDGQGAAPSLAPETAARGCRDGSQMSSKLSSVASRDESGSSKGVPATAEDEKIQKSIDECPGSEEPRPFLGKQVEGTPRIRSKFMQGFRSGSAQPSKSRTVTIGGRSGFTGMAGNSLLSTSVPEETTSTKFGVTSPPRSRQSKPPLTSRDDKLYSHPKTPVPVRRELKEPVGFRSSTATSARRSAVQLNTGRYQPIPEPTPRLRGSTTAGGSASRQLSNGVGLGYPRKGEKTELQCRGSSPLSQSGSGERRRSKGAGLKRQGSPQTLTQQTRDSSPGSGSRSGGNSGGAGKQRTGIVARRALSPKLENVTPKTCRVGIRIRDGTGGPGAPSFAQPVRRRFSLSPMKELEGSDSTSS